MLGLLLLLLIRYLIATETKVYALFGPSQAGKSSFANWLAGRPLAEVGYEMGISRTTKCQEYFIEHPDGNLVILDVPGLSDNFNNFTDERIMEKIREKILGYLTAIFLELKTEKNGIDGIIFFEPLDNDYSQVRQTIAKAEQLFGPRVYESSLVVFTKGDLDYARHPDELGHIPTCEWSSHGLDDYEMNMNWNLMKTKLAALQPYFAEEMEIALAEVHSLAKLACENQPPRYINVSVNETRQEPDGFKKVKVMRSLPPVTRYRTERRRFTEQQLVSKSRSFAELRTEFVRIFLEARPHITGAESWFHEVSQVASVCAQIYMQDIRKKTDDELQEELSKKWPFVWPTNPNNFYSIITVNQWKQIIIKARGFGCGTDIYTTVARESTIDVPYTEVKTVKEIVMEPRFKTVTEIVEKNVVAPKLPEEEFIDQAKGQKAKSIRDDLEKKI